MNWIRRNVQPSERASGLGEHGLADAGDVLDQDVALGEQRDHAQADGVVLALDDVLDGLAMRSKYAANASKDLLDGPRHEPHGTATSCAYAQRSARQTGQPGGRPVGSTRWLSKRILLAAPRGWCAGVERAVDIVERALDLYGPPIYVRKQIVHNRHVVEGLEKRGAIFVDEVDEVPRGRTASCLRTARPRSSTRRHASAELHLIDATCPLVTKVHVEAIRFAKRERTIVLIGHAGHEEVEGTMGQAPTRTVLVEDVADAEPLEVADPDNVSYITQTTLSVDDTADIVETLRRSVPRTSRRRRSPTSATRRRTGRPR